MEQFIKKGGDAGFIYISFGSAVKISTIPQETLKIFFDAIRNTKLQYLWKWEGDAPKDAPPNIFFKNWFPQQDVLGINRSS